MKRRTWLMAGSAAAAAGLGVGVGGAWLRSRETAPVALSAGLAEPNTAAAEAAFWQMSFETPAGGTLTMASLRGQPLLLNFWATWCPPCVQEMPELDHFARQFAPQGWRVVGLAVDNPKAVREFLTRSPVSYAIGLAGFAGADLSRTLGNEQSGLPYTVAFGRDGTVLQRKAGATNLDELTRWAQLR